MLYGCHVGAEGQGHGFLTGLAEATQADVAASNDLTGAASHGGDWDLESRVGLIGTGHPFSDTALDSFSAILGVPPTDPFTSTPSGYSLSGSTAIGNYFEVSVVAGLYNLSASGGTIENRWL